MLSAIFQFAVCAAIIIVAGSFLTRFADAIAEITKLGRLLVGSVLLAGATSLPELTVDIAAIRLDLPDLAVGDLLGSSLMNLLILAMCDLTHYSRGRMLSRQAAAHALSGSMSAALAAIVAIGIMTGKTFESWALWGISPAIFVLALAYVFGVRLVFLDQRISLRTVQETLGAEVPHAPPMTLARALLGFAICAAVIFFTGPYLAASAGELAKITGLGSTFVGTTLVAMSTSLPELVSTFAALRMGALDLAIGNVFGSNAFNMILLVPLDFIYPKSLLAAVSHRHVITAVAAMLATLVAVMGQLYHAESRRRLIEPDALLVILIVIGSLWLVYYVP